MPSFDPHLLLPFHIVCSSGSGTGTLLSSRSLPRHFSTRSLFRTIAAITARGNAGKRFNSRAPVSSSTKWGRECPVPRRVAGRGPPAVLSEMAHFPFRQCFFSDLICRWGLQLSRSHMFALEGGEHPKNQRTHNPHCGTVTGRLVRPLRRFILQAEITHTSLCPVSC